MIGVDANVLVALAAGTHPAHSQAVPVFQGELAAGEEIVRTAQFKLRIAASTLNPYRLAWLIHRPR